MEPLPSICYGDRVVLRNTEDINVSENMKKIDCTIQGYSGTDITVHSHDGLDTERAYDIEFVLNRLSYRLEHLAIQRTIELGISDFLFPIKDQIKKINSPITL